MKCKDKIVDICKPTCCDNQGGKKYFVSTIGSKCRSGSWIFRGGGMVQHISVMGKNGDGGNARWECGSPSTPESTTASLLIYMNSSGGSLNFSF